MEIINCKAATMCNYEVMYHLQQVRDHVVRGRTRNDNRLGQLATITYETLQYLDTTAAKSSTVDDIRSCCKALKDFNISKNERLGMINTPPTSPLEIQLIVEESEEKLTEEQENEILVLTKTHFPHVYAQNEEENEDTQV